MLLPAAGRGSGRVGDADVVQRLGDRRVEHVERRLGVEAEHEERRDQRGDDRLLAQRDVAEPAASSGLGPVIIRWYISRM